MYCKNCGNPVDPNAAVCLHCGFAKGSGMSYCPNCGQPTIPGAAVCTSCGCGLAAAPGADAKSKMAAGLLGIFLGGWGIHNFYLGYTGKAVAQILLSCVGIGQIWGLIEGILILCGNIDKDARGVPLKD